MPHDNTTDTPVHADTEWGWLDNPAPAAIPIPLAAPHVDDSEWGWVPEDLGDVETVGISDTGESDQRTSAAPLRRWATPIVTILLSISVIIAAVLALRGTTEATTTKSTNTVPSPSPTAQLTGACAGLTAATVTAGPGDLATVTGVIAAFEYAYYYQRSADGALAMLTPDAGIAREPLASGIASIPAGTTHCVAITPIADATADVHLVELHPDHSRTDYLQVINLRHAPTGLLINNIQKQG